MSPSEQMYRLHYWVSAMVLVFVAALILGTCILAPIGQKVMHEKLSNQTSQRFLSTREGNVVLGLVYFMTLAICAGAVVFCFRTGRLSMSTGPDWEVYFILFSIHCLWFVVQAAIRRVLADGKSNDKLPCHTFARCLLGTVPFLSDAFDTLKDCIFVGLCMRRDQTILSIIAGLHVIFIHGSLWVAGSKYRSYLASFHIPVLAATPETIPALPRAECKEVMNMLILFFFKQTTSTKINMLLLENVPQGIFAMVPGLHSN